MIVIPGLPAAWVVAKAMYQKFLAHSLK